MILNLRRRFIAPIAGWFISIMASSFNAAEEIMEQWKKRRSVLRMIIVIFIISILSGAAYLRNGIWLDEVTLLKDVVEKSPRKARLYVNLGNVLDRTGHFEDAIAAYKTAIELSPRHQPAYYNLGVAYFNRSMFCEARSAFQTALLLKPSDQDALEYLKLISDLLNQSTAPVCRQ